MSDNCQYNVESGSTATNERVTLIVVIITLVTMITEIVAGIISGSMALLSDGVHMGTHALALFITLGAYIIARRNRSNPSFSFGTGKVGILGGYTNAILLIVAGVFMAIESVERLIAPVRILFNEAIVIAVIGLVVNVLSAFILSKGEGSHHHGNHLHDVDHSHEDHNLKAAYLHVITDALTSVLAIGALLSGKFLGFIWADPFVGILGAIVVIRWAIGLLKSTGAILLDKGDFNDEIKKIRQHLIRNGAVIHDIHIWQLSENNRSLIVSLECGTNRGPQDYHKLISEVATFQHITVEINPC